MDAKYTRKRQARNERAFGVDVHRLLCRPYGDGSSEMTLKGQARRDYMRLYMRRRRGSPLADTPIIPDVKPEQPVVEIKQSPYPTGAEPVKPRLVKPITKQYSARGRTRE